MYPYNAVVSEPATGETTQVSSGSKTFYDTFNSHTLTFAVAPRRLLARQANPIFKLNYDNSVITFDNTTRDWDTSPLSYNVNYSSSDGVTANTWYDQSISGCHVTCVNPHYSLPVTQGMSTDWALITGVGSRPTFNMTANNYYTNPLTDDFTWVCLMRSTAHGAVTTGLNWRSTSSNTLLDGRIATSNNDILIGVGLSTLFIGMGQSGGADTFLQGTVPIVNNIYTDPKLIVVRRTSSTGNVDLRVNRAPDTSGTMATGSLTGIPTINFSPNAFITEMMVFNEALSLSDTQQMETEIALYYGLA